MILRRKSKRSHSGDVVALSGVSKVYPGRTGVRALDDVTVSFGPRRAPDGHQAA